MNELTFDGINIKDFNTYITNAGFYAAPERRYRTFQVAGRNGDLSIDNGDYNNLEITFPGVIHEEFPKSFSALRGFLYSRKGYKKLQTSFAPEEYRKAIFKHIEDVAVSREGALGSFVLVFESMPQRFLESGEIPVELTSSGNVFNPTRYDSKPLLRVWGNGNLGVGSTTITIANTTDYTDIDCDMMDAFHGAENRNSKITLAEFPVLPAGKTGITLGAGISKVIVTPRWWTI